VVAALGCTGDLPACLRSHTAAEVIAAVPTSASILVSTPFQPEIDGTIQPVQPAVAIAAGTHHHVPFMIGSNADETGKQVPAIADEAAYEAALTAQFGTAIGNQVLAQYPVSRFPTPRAAYVRVTTDARFVCPTRTFARDFAAGQTEPTYRYLFQYPATLFGAVHGIELPFVFGTLDTIVVNGTAHVPTSTELAVSAAMQADWTSFARTGVPAGAPTWPAYVTATDPARTYDAATGVVAGIRTADCDFWDGLH
jgi:para-nitrobenzyl esterase